MAQIKSWTVPDDLCNKVEPPIPIRRRDGSRKYQRKPKGRQQADACSAGFLGYHLRAARGDSMESIATRVRLDLRGASELASGRLFSEAVACRFG